MEQLETILKELLDAMGASYKGISHSEIAGQDVVSIETDDGRGLIGPRGEGIQAIEHLAKKIYEHRTKSPDEEVGAHREPLAIIDINDYQTKRIKELQTKALMMADRARSFQYDVELTPMSSYERLIVHTTLQGAPNVKTESQGEGRGRRVVIKYAAE